MGGDSSKPIDDTEIGPSSISEDIKYDTVIDVKHVLIEESNIYNSTISSLNHNKYIYDEDGEIVDVKINNSNLNAELSQLFGTISGNERINQLIQHSSLDNLIQQYGHFDFTEYDYPGCANAYTIDDFIRLENGDFYIGQIDSQEHPYGAGLLFNDSALIEGYFVDGKVDGICRIYTLGGDLYQGTYSAHDRASQKWSVVWNRQVCVL